MSLQDDLLSAFMDPARFGTPECFAARAEMERLMAKCAALEQKLLKLESAKAARVTRGEAQKEK